MRITSLKTVKLTCIQIIICTLLMLGSSSMSFAQDTQKSNKWNNSIKVALGKKTGSVTYQIGGNFRDGTRTGTAHFPLSELKWQTETDTTKALLNLSPDNAWQIQLAAEVSSSANTGILEDRDWLARDTLTGYSESKTTLKFREYFIAANRAISFSSATNSNNSFKQAIGLGLLYQSYEFKGFDTRQISLTSGNSEQFFAGDVIKYELNQTTPFIQYSLAKSLTNGFELVASALYSPYSFISDDDQHLLAGKTAKSSSNGWLFSIDIGLNWHLSQHFKLNSLINFYQFETDGEQTQTAETQAGTETYHIEIKHLGKMTNYRLGLEYLF